MADESQEQPEGGGGSPLMSIIVALVVLLLAAGSGFGVYAFVIAPRLASDGPGEEEIQPVEEDVIPAMPVSVRFDQKFVNVMREGDNPASMLIFQVTLECGNQMTADIINTHRIRFEDMLIKLHDSRTRSELDDTLAIKTSIQRQAKQRSNDLLQRLQETPDPTNEVTGVFHNLFTVQEQG